MDSKEPIAQVRIGNVKTVIFDDYSVLPAHRNDDSSEWEVIEGFRGEELGQLAQCLARAHAWISSKQNVVPV